MRPQAPTPADEVAPHDAASLGGRSLLGLALVVAGAIPFLALLGLVKLRWAPLADLDTGVAQGLNASVAASPLSVRVLSIASEAGGGATASFVMAVAVVCLLMRRRYALAAYVTVAGVGLAILVPVTKALIGRTRPDVPLPVVELPTNASFPSGHAMTSLVTWGALLLVLLPGLRPTARRWWTVAAVGLVVLVGFTRIALGVHFVSDVLAGWGLGVAWLAVVTIAFRGWLRSRGEPVAAVGTGVVTGPVAPGSAPTLPDGARSVGRIALGAVAVLAVVVLLGLGLTRLLASGPVADLDRALLTAAVELRSPALTSVVETVGSLAGLWGVVMATVAGAAIAAAYLRSWRPVVLLVAAVVGEVLLYGAAAAVVGRARPDVADLTDGLPAGASFPSGHAAAATVVYGGIALLVVASTRTRWHWAVVALAAVVVLAIGASRVYVAAHRPSDVVAGVVLGVLWLAVLHRALPIEPPPRPAPRPATAPAVAPARPQVAR
ncbi:phosphatase PAP2 family protein [uncultured Cellulomonas sp.]|uniref:phosphatase PAP2 family protein n=1 Tax=uncultured Cellulomonas sp. TaxID=189682 RepID=UPI00262F9D28|nr:phosphatase PAP2 family protein [uncultured Cellulomonas sp.]